MARQTPYERWLTRMSRIAKREGISLRDVIKIWGDYEESKINRGRPKKRSKK